MLGSKQNKNEIYAKSSNLIACTLLKLKLSYKSWETNKGKHSYARQHVQRALTGLIEKANHLGS